MNINVNEGDGFTVVELEGDIDMSCSPNVRKSVLEVLENNRNLLINLSQVSYIDSSGIASLVEGYQTAKKKSLNFGLVSISEPAMSVLKLARLDKVFPIFTSEEEFK